MSGDNWRVEEWTQNGNRTGFRIVRGFGAKLEVYKGYTGNVYVHRSFDEAQATAEAVCAELNDEIDHSDVLDWPNGRGFTPCTPAYRTLLDIRNDIYDPNSGGSLEDLSMEDYNRWNRLEDFLASLHLNGHLGQGERL